MHPPPLVANGADLPPSHPEFDRTGILEAQFIEMLVFENRELQATVSKQEQIILGIRERINGTFMDWDKSDTKAASDSNVPRVANLSKTTSSNATNAVGKTEKDEVKAEVAEPAPEIAETKAAEPPVASGSAALSPDVPVRSARRRRDDDAASANTTFDEKESKSDSDKFENTEKIDRSVLEKEPVSLDLEKNIGRLPAHDSLDTSLDVRDSIDDQSSLYSEPLPVRPAERRMASSAETPLTQHKNASNSSFGSSYKPRLKLPATLKNGSRAPSALAPPIPSSLQYPLTTQISDDLESTMNRTIVSVSSNNGPVPPVTPDALHLNEFPSSILADDRSITSNPQSPPLNEPLRTSLGLLLHESLTAKLSRQPTTPGSSFLVVQSPLLEDEERSLLVQPDNFNTIDIVVASTINIQPREGSLQRKPEDPNVTISICDRAASKEMWRIRKSYLQLVAFDHELRPIVEYFGLPSLPEKMLFFSSSPAKVDARRLQLQDYFNTLFLIPHIPRMLLFRICKYLSADLVNPLDDFKSGAFKEGFLIRRYKGLGSTWKIRWCQVDGPYLEIYDSPGGTLLEQLGLWHTQIGRQSTDSVAEDRGYRHAFLILESERTKMSSNSKHFFCAESDTERDSWISAMIQFTGWSESATPAESTDSLSRGPNDRMGSTERLDHKQERDDEETKEMKKSRKRSLFPFRKTVVPDESLSHQPSDIMQLLQQLYHTQNTSLQPPVGTDSLQLYISQMQLDDKPASAVFGRDINEVFQLSNHVFQGRAIPSICFRCLDYLLKTGAVYEEGIFRLSGSASQIRSLKEQFNNNFDVDLFGPLLPDIHTVAGLFKTYLRELPHPILGEQAYSDLQHIVISRGDTGSKLSLAYIFRDYLNSPGNMTAINYDLCYVIFGFLKYVIENRSRNKMSLRNVCIVFVPTLNISLDVLSTLLTDYDCIFAGGEPVPDHAREVLDVHIPNF